MAPERIRLSERARKKLINLADQADLEPAFLLEYLINRYGNEAIKTLNGQEGSLGTLTNTNDPVIASLRTQSYESSGSGLDFATLIANA